MWSMGVMMPMSPTPLPALVLFYLLNIAPQASLH